MTSPASVSEHFFKKCADKIQENTALLVKKFTEAPNALQDSLSGVLVDAAKGDFGPLLDAGKDYLKQNGDSLMLEALGATGLEGSVLDALNLFYNMLAQAISAYNDLILLMLKRSAKKIIEEIDKKEEANTSLKKTLQDLLTALLALTSGDPVFEKYIKDLRLALLQLESGRVDILTVRNILDRQERFFGKQFKRGKKSVEAGVALIKSTTSQIQSQQVGRGVLADLGLPKTSTGAEVNALLAVPKKSKKVIDYMGVYSSRTTVINARLLNFYAGLDALQSGIPAVMKKYMLQRFDSTLSKLQDLIKTMALVLNGSETATSGPAPGYKAQALPVTVNAFKWAMDAQLVMQSFKLIPTGHVVLERQANAKALPRGPTNGKVLQGPTLSYFKKVSVGDNVEIFNTARPGTYRVVKTFWSQGKVTPPAPAQPDPRVLVASSFTQPAVPATLTNPPFALDEGEIELDRVINNSITTIQGVDYEITSDALGALQLNFQVVEAYETTVKHLRSLGTVSNGGAALVATEAQENVPVFSQQLLGFLLEAVNTVSSNSIRPQALSLCRSFIQRCDLVTARDNDIKKTLQAFIDTPIPSEDTLVRILDGLEQMLDNLSLDKARDLLKDGDFANFFNLNSKTATYIGSALLALAVLKDCFTNDADKAKFSEIENNIKGDADLLNFKIPLDFDFAIFKNLQDCIDLTALAGLLQSKEFICGLLQDTLGDSTFNKLKDVLSF